VFQLFLSCTGIGIEIGHSEKLVAGLFDAVFHPQPVEQHALGLPLAGGDFEQAPDELGSFYGTAFSLGLGPIYG